MRLRINNAYRVLLYLAGNQHVGIFSQYGDVLKWVESFGMSWNFIEIRPVILEWQQAPGEMPDCASEIKNPFEEIHGG